MVENHRNQRRGEPARFRLVPGAGGAGILTATYRRHAFAPHAHSTWTFAIVHRGAMNTLIGGVADRLAIDSLIVIPPGVIHSATPADRDGWDYVSVYPTAAAIARCVARISPSLGARQPQGVIRSRRLAGLCDRLAAELCDGDDVAIHTLDELVEGAWHATSRQGHANREPVACIERAMAYIREHACERLTLQMMADSAGLSSFHFMRRFHRVVGTTPYAFYAQLRVERAREMLERGISIVESAYDCGFVDQSHLNRHFKRIVGVTPGAYLAGLPQRRAG